MTCFEVKELLSEYIDGECEKSAEITEHLENCKDCKKEYEELLKLKASFKVFVPRSERSLADSVISEIRRETFPEKKIPFIFRHIGLVASLAIIVTVAILALPKTENAEKSMKDAPAPSEESEEVYIFESVKKESAENNSFATEEILTEPEYADISKSEEYLVPTDDRAQITLPEASLNVSLVLPEEELIRAFDEEFEVEVIDGGIKTYEEHDEILNFIYQNEYEIDSMKSFWEEKPVITVISSK